MRRRGRAKLRLIPPVHGVILYLRAYVIKWGHAERIETIPLYSRSLIAVSSAIDKAIHLSHLTYKPPLQMYLALSAVEEERIQNPRDD